MPLFLTGFSSAVGVYVLAFPTFKDIIDAIKEVLKLIYHGDPPVGLLQLVGYILLFGLVLGGIFGLLFIVDKIADLWGTRFWPLFYNHDKKQRAFNRRKFAEHVEKQLERLDAREEWKDYRFAELEAEVNAEGRGNLFGILSRFGSRTTLRQEPSLSRALKNSKERLILVEGDPGSGKSVALRHAAQELARKARNSRGLKTPIPIYINLKEFERLDGSQIDRDFVHSFILKTLNRANDRDIEKFLEEEFDQGIKGGTWVFLFDSFDEIPEVLSSIEADAVIQQYADAISAFLGGFNSCRGVTASRYFRGPKQFGWPHFRILPLSQRRRFELIRKANLTREQQKQLRTQLLSAEADMWAMTSNPMFLSLLCAHIRDKNPFPENGYRLYESYISSRFSRDAERLMKHFQLEAPHVRTAAEIMAFCMTADFKLGLSPTREALKDSVERLGFSVNDADRNLDALEYIKLARSETGATATEKHQFTFGHRRFQEYFATCVVLSNTDRVSEHDLLSDARWRETAVVMCQTQELEVIRLLIAEAQAMIGIIAKGVSDELEEKKYVIERTRPQLPARCFHILGLLQEGFSRRMDLLPDDLREAASKLLTHVSRNGSLWDRKTALEVAGVMPHKDLHRILSREFLSESFWLREVAFRQVARLTQIPEDIAGQIQKTLVLLFALKRLHQERGFIQAHLTRLNRAERFLSTLQLLIWLRRIDFLLIGLAIALCLFGNYSDTLYGGHQRGWPFSLIVIVSILFFLLLTAQTVFSLSLLWFKSAPARAAFFIAGLRLFLLLVLQVAIRASKTPFAFQINVLLIVWAVWAPSALYAAMTHRVRPRWLLWPVLPVVPLVYLAIEGAKYAPRLLRGAIKAREQKPRTVPRPKSDWKVYFFKRRSSWRRALEVLGGYVFIPIAVGGVLTLLKRFPKVTAGLAATLFLAILAGLVFFSTPVLVDWWRLRRYKRTNQQIDGSDLIQLLGDYNTDSFRIRLLRHVRAENLAQSDRKTMDAIEMLGWRLERGSRYYPFDWTELREYVPRHEPRQRYFDPVTNSLRNHADMVDEVYRLLEQLKSRAA
jgi:hypothetical protein